MNKTIFLLFLLQLPIGLSAQIVYPNFGTYVTQKNINHAKDAINALNKGTIIKIKFEAELNAARDAFWMADSLGNISDAARDEYAYLLYQKDMYFLMFDFIDQSTYKLTGIQGAKEGAVIFEELTGGPLDKGINSYSGDSFKRWSEEVCRQYFSQTHKIDDVDLLISIMDKEEVQKLYFDYVKERDFSESIYKNRYTSKRRWKEYQDAKNEKYRQADARNPYERIRLFSSFEKLEDEISRKPMIEILNKYESRQIKYDSQGGATSIYDVAPYEEGDLLDLPEKMRARVMEFGTGKRPKKDDTVKLIFYDKTDNPDLTVKKYNHAYPLDLKKIGERTFAVNELNKDFGFMVRMMSEGGVWMIQMEAKYGDLPDKSLQIFYNEAVAKRFCWVMVELIEIN
jgi:hypothetical protein